MALACLYEIASRTVIQPKQRLRGDKCPSQSSFRSPSMTYPSSSLPPSYQKWNIALLSPLAARRRTAGETDVIYVAPAVIHLLGNSGSPAEARISVHLGSENWTAEPASFGRSCCPTHAPMLASSGQRALHSANIVCLRCDTGLRGARRSGERRQQRCSNDISSDPNPTPRFGHADGAL
jgi:hypothetical protein